MATKEGKELAPEVFLKHFKLEKAVRVALVRRKSSDLEEVTGMLKWRSERVVPARTKRAARGIEKGETTSSCRGAAVGLQRLFERCQRGNSGPAGRLGR